MSHTLSRYTAFSETPEGGNPAGVWIGDDLPSETEMQQLAAKLGYSETVFLAPNTGPSRLVRYFTPEVEVPFCGHATIASGVVLGETEGGGRYSFSTPAGEVTVDVVHEGDRWIASLTSVTPRQEPISEQLLGDILESLHWSAEEVDRSFLPMRIFAGLNHLVLAAATSDRLAALDYDFDRLKQLMETAKLDTLQLIWREGESLFHSRNPCPAVGITEDPATGSAAAALGGYLRDQGLIDAPATITVLQGETMGRPSTITVEIPGAGGMVVSGTAVPIG